MARPDVWMPFYGEDYSKKTAHCSAVERGAYMDLLWACWTRQNSLPTDDNQLMRLARCTPDEWKVARDTVMAFFYLDGLQYRNKRVGEELAEATARYERKVASGRAGGLAKAKHTSSNARAVLLAEGVAKPYDKGTQPQPQSITPPSEGADAPLKERIFGPALDWLAKQTGKKPQQVRALLGKWCAQSGDGPTLQALTEAAKNSPLDPIPYIERILNPKASHAKPTAKQNASAHVEGLARALGVEPLATAGPGAADEGRTIDGDCRAVSDHGTGEPAGVRPRDGGSDRVRIGVRDTVPGPAEGPGDLPGRVETPSGGSDRNGDSTAQIVVGVAERDAAAGGYPERGQGGLREAAIAALAGENGGIARPGPGHGEKRGEPGKVRPTKADDSDDGLEIPKFLDRRPKVAAA